MLKKLHLSVYKRFPIFCQEVAAVFTHKRARFTNVFLRGFSWSCIDFVYAL
jgi:hypothetical protein